MPLAPSKRHQTAALPSVIRTLPHEVLKALCEKMGWWREASALEPDRLKNYCSSRVTPGSAPDIGCFMSSNKQSFVVTTDFATLEEIPERLLFITARSGLWYKFNAISLLRTLFVNGNMNPYTREPLTRDDLHRLRAIYVTSRSAGMNPLAYRIANSSIAYEGKRSLPDVLRKIRIDRAEEKAARGAVGALNRLLWKLSSDERNKEQIIGYVRDTLLPGLRRSLRAIRTDWRREQLLREMKRRLCADEESCGPTPRVCRAMRAALPCLWKSVKPV